MARTGSIPLELFQTRKDEASLRAFLDFRAGLARRMQEEWIGVIEQERRAKPALDLVLTHVDDRFESGMRDAIGADAGRVLPLLEKHDFTFLIEDPATVWNLGPQRYPEIAKRYQPLTAGPRSWPSISISWIAIRTFTPPNSRPARSCFNWSISPQARFRAWLSTSRIRFCRPILPFSARPARSCSVWRRTETGSPSSRRAELAFAGMALRKWMASLGRSAMAPWSGCQPGRIPIDPRRWRLRVRILDFNGELRSAQLLAASQIELSYQSSSRALAVVDRKPVRLKLDGVEAAPGFLPARKHYSLVLPRGQHLVTSGRGVMLTPSPASRSIDWKSDERSGSGCESG